MVKQNLQKEIDAIKTQIDDKTRIINEFQTKLEQNQQELDKKSHESEQERHKLTESTEKFESIKVRKDHFTKHSCIFLN